MATQNYFKVKNGLEFPSIETLQTTDNTGPSINPSLNLDFAKTKALDPRITFSRASTASYYDGKSVVKAEENLLTYSQAFNDGAWAKSNVTLSANTAVAPDGTSTANSIVEGSASNDWHWCGRTLAKPASALDYTYTIYVKPVNRTWFMMTISDGGSNPYRCWFDLANMTVGRNSGGGGFQNIVCSIVKAENGYYRTQISFLSTATSSVQVYFHPASGDFIQLLSGVSGQTSAYVWGAQLEQRAYATAYTPTTGSAITNYIPVLQTAATNTARFDHDPITGESKGLLIEEARTNLLLASQDFESDNFGAWRKQSGPGTAVGVSAKAAVAPDGTLTAQKLFVASGTSGYFNVYQGMTWSASTTYTLSVYAKSSDHNQIALSMVTSVGNAIVFNTDTGQVVSQYNSDAGFVYVRNGYVDVGNGWKRLFVTFTTPAGVSGGQVKIEVGNATNIAGKGIYIWGAQLEVGSFATSYIPTPLTHTGRGSAATYTAVDGLIRTAAANVARYEPNSSGGSNLLLESAASNSAQYTAISVTNIANLGNGFVNVGFSSQAPDGSNATLYIAKTGNVNYLYTFGAITTSIGTTYTRSIFVKNKSNNANQMYITLFFDISVYGSYYGAIFNPATGQFTNISAGVTAGSSYVGGGWYRIWATKAATAAAPDSFQARIGNSPTDMYQNGYGDNTSGMYVWGAQHEAGSLTSYIPSVETHTGRSSTGTYYDSTGTIRTAASGQPRYTYNPSMLTAPPKLLLEAQATNVVTNSITMFPSGNITRADNVTTSPEGTTTGSSWTEYSGGSTYQRTNVTITHAAGNTYCVSIYAKAGLRNYVTLDYGPLIYFNLTTGEATGTTTLGGANGLKGYGSQYVGNGWWRCWITYAYDVAGGQVYLGTSVNGSDSGLYTGNSSAPAFYAWGIQKEVGYAPTSYIATSGSAVTRAADTSTSVAQTRAADVYSSSQVTRLGDTASITGSNFSSWYRQDEGSLYGETVIGGVLPANAFGQVFDIRSTSSDRMSLFYNPGTTNNVGYFASTSGISQAVLYGNASVNSIIKLSAAYKANDFAFTYNGSNISVDSSGIIPTATFANIGNNSGSPLGQQWIKKIAYYPKRLSNAELVSITS